MDFVRMKHPDIEGLSQEVTRESFDRVHSHKGWVLASETDIAELLDDVNHAADIAGTDTAEGTGTTTMAASSAATRTKAGRSKAGDETGS